MTQSEQIIASLARIEGLLAELIEATRVRRRRKPNAKAKREAGLIQQGRAASGDSAIIDSVVAQWKTICPRNPPPMLDDEYRLEILEFWKEMGEEIDAVQGMFDVIGNSHYWSDKARDGKGVSMREVIRNPRAFLEGYAR